MTHRFYFEVLDYAEIASWWSARPNWAPVPATLLPQTGFGIVVEDNEVPVAAGFVYRDGAFGFLEWIVTNPKTSVMRKKAAIERLIDALLATGQQYGVKSWLTTTVNRRLLKLFEARGFKVTDRDVIHLIKSE